MHRCSLLAPLLALRKYRLRKNPRVKAWIETIQERCRTYRRRAIWPLAIAYIRKRGRGHEVPNTCTQSAARVRLGCRVKSVKSATRIARVAIVRGFRSEMHRVRVIRILKRAGQKISKGRRDTPGGKEDVRGNRNSIISLCWWWREGATLTSPGAFVNMFGTVGRVGGDQLMWQPSAQRLSFTRKSSPILPTSHQPNSSPNT